MVFAKRDFKILKNRDISAWRLPRCRSSLELGAGKPGRRAAVRDRIGQNGHQPGSKNRYDTGGSGSDHRTSAESVRLDLKAKTAEISSAAASLSAFTRRIGIFLRGPMYSFPCLFRRKIDIFVERNRKPAHAGRANGTKRRRKTRIRGRIQDESRTAARMDYQRVIPQ